ncbi:MAG: hypothetical protein KBT87_02390 [Gammaproteobacteria bacterium]|nr:hypothetical protein [Gammaproteobacteria bacterium]MBQ0773498.1 hypothetical protein [Gammaproteobacteria bacterium]|tara:strand:+ start:84655 stop:85506 length:852 start_codon:yes stop_codon:yes gene_type:complete
MQLPTSIKIAAMMMLLFPFTPTHAASPSASARTAQSSPDAHNADVDAESHHEDQTAEHWRQITDRNGIQVSVNYDENSRLKQFRGVTVMSLTDEYAMLALYNDVEAFPRWLHLISEASLIEEHSMIDKDLRFLIKMPWPVSDREVLLKATLVHVTREDNESVTAYLNGTPDLLPLNDDYIRVPEINGLFSFQRIAPGKVKVTYQISLALGGYLPNWLVNLTTRDIPYFTLEKLRRIVVTEPYKNQYYPELNLFGPGRPDDAPTIKSWVYQTGLDMPESAPATH